MTAPIPPQSEEGKPRHLYEDIFIILCIISLWPSIFGLQGLIYELALYAALIGLVVILVRRVKRFRQAREELDNK
ncbi:MAG: hypothetical protein GKR89_22415 [Candidatus Latescibacteria bacterium]|nr:hypothetical protein [Candidatus Latescibacterota bacterium]